MEHHSSCNNAHEHVITMEQGNITSSSASHQDFYDNLDELLHDDLDRSLTNTQTTTSQSSASASPSTYELRDAASARVDSVYSQNGGPLNSGLWISAEFTLCVAQIIAAVIVLLYSRHEHPHAPLFAWVIGYAAGCAASLPHIYWRFVRRNRQPVEQDFEEAPSMNPGLMSQPQEAHDRSASRMIQFGIIVISCPRPHVLAYHFKMCLNCFFAVWFVVGNVWIFGGHSSPDDSPNLYRLCLIFLSFSCIGYAIPVFICTVLCCCFPCIVSALRLQEDLRQHRGATPEMVSALPAYKFKASRCKNQENVGDGGILGPGTKKERIISAEDALCCICLVKYLDDDELRELPCHHVFHVHCVDKWLKINAVCPLCKSEVAGTLRSLFGIPLGRRRTDRTSGRAGPAAARFSVE